MPMITMYAVANIDSALWGTRSIGEVMSTSTTIAGSVSDTDTDADSATDKAVRQNPSHDTAGHGDCTGSGGGIMMRAFALSQAQCKPQTTASDGDDEEAVPLKGHKRHSSDVLAGGSDDDGDASAGEAEQGETEGCGGGSGAEGRGNLSLRAWKFVILSSWMLVNVGLTASCLRWRLDTLAALGFFSQTFGLVFFIVTAWLEMRLQRSYALPPSRHG